MKKYPNPSPPSWFQRPRNTKWLFPRSHHLSDVSGPSLYQICRNLLQAMGLTLAVMVVVFGGLQTALRFDRFLIATFVVALIYRGVPTFNGNPDSWKWD